MYFKGFYFKHYKDGKTVSFIPGISDDGAFIQVITDKKSCFFNFKSFSAEEVICIDDNVFSKQGIKISLPGIQGNIDYTGIAPIKSDIMGIFKYFPLECKHEIISMRHKLKGYLVIDNEIYDFNDGVGYIEGDHGTSFPKRYIWIQSNCTYDLSITISVAEIPLWKLHFRGCICAILYKNTEYRLATYLGAKASIIDNQVIIKQGSYTLIAEILHEGTNYALASPVGGKMQGIIHENNDSVIRFRFYVKNNLIFDITTKYAGYERYNY